MRTFRAIHNSRITSNLEFVTRINLMREKRMGCGRLMFKSSADLIRMLDARNWRKIPYSLSAPILIEAMGHCHHQQMLDISKPFFFRIACEVCSVSNDKMEFS